MKNEIKFRKAEIKKYSRLIKHIRDEMTTGRDFWASLFSGGLTFTDDIERFGFYARIVGAEDISKEIEKSKKRKKKSPKSTPREKRLTGCYWSATKRLTIF